MTPRKSDKERAEKLAQSLLSGKAKRGDIKKILNVLTLVRAEETRRLIAEYDDEVDEFNAGYKAYKDGNSINDEPQDTIYDTWKIGWVWAKYNE